MDARKASTTELYHKSYANTVNFPDSTEGRLLRNCTNNWSPSRNPYHWQQYNRQHDFTRYLATFPLNVYKSCEFFQKPVCFMEPLNVVAPTHSCIEILIALPYIIFFFFFLCRMGIILTLKLKHVDKQVVWSVNLISRHLRRHYRTLVLRRKLRAQGKFWPLV